MVVVLVLVVVVVLVSVGVDNFLVEGSTKTNRAYGGLGRDEKRLEALV